MEPSALEQFKEILYAAIQQSPEQRAEFLAKACGNNENLRTGVTSLLAEHDDGDVIAAEEIPAPGTSTRRFPQQQPEVQP
jgi:hypothetical protein